MTLTCALLYTDKMELKLWTNSLKNQQEISCEPIDLSRNNWYEKCVGQNYDLYILRPPGSTNLLKQMFDERVEILSDTLDVQTYPSLIETKLYENKKYLAYWLKAKGLPAPRTEVFYQKDDALNWLERTTFPLVGKVNIGASGKGVKIIGDRKEGFEYIAKAFKKGIRPYIGPNFKSSSVMSKFSRILKKKGLLRKRMISYALSYKEPQKYVLLQEYIPHQFEWRVVVIGDSYFAHKKVVTGEKASGSLRKDYSNPPLDLFDFVFDVCNKNKLSSVSLDIFESSSGYLINEIQTYFGQSDSYQMKVNGVIGRYLRSGNEWVFEPGDFARNQCYDLRIEHILKKQRKKV